MNSAVEFACFSGVALVLHVGFWSSLGDAGSEAAGAEGAAPMSLMAAPGEVADLVRDWTRPVEVQASLAALAEAPQGEALDVALSAPVPVARVELVAVASLEAPSVAPRLPRVPEGLAAVAAADVAPVLAAPDLPTARPVHRPEASLQVARVEPMPLVETTAPPKPVAPPSAAVAPQQAAGTAGGTHAGDRAAAQPATLSKAARQSLLAQWGATIRNRVEKRKSYPRGTRASGTTVLRVTVSRSGALVVVAVAKSSGHPDLDRAAVKAVRKARYPAAPKGLEAGEYHFNLPLAFRRG